MESVNFVSYLTLTGQPWKSMLLTRVLREIPRRNSISDIFLFLPDQKNPECYTPG